MRKLKTSAVILSTGRTGTMFFSHTLGNLAPGAQVFHEAGERSRLINILFHAYLGRLIPIQLPLWAWDRVVGKDLKACHKEVYIDSNNQIYALVPEKPELYPGLKVVHIVRDPRDYVRSHINWSRHRPKSFIANYLTPFWQPNGFLLGEMPFSTWVGLSRFERFCWIWDFKNRTIESIAMKGVPYLRVRFEDFFAGSNPEIHLNRILDFIGLPTVKGQHHHFEKAVNPGRKRTFQSWRNWSPRLCCQLRVFCGETMLRYGYGKEPEWSEKLGLGG
jgi:hypothetical protein